MRIIVVFIFACISLIASAQQFKREGNTFVQDTTKTFRKSEGKETKYTYRDKNNKVYPIFITSSGAVYINRVSAKTGKEYRMYLPKGIKEAIAKEIKQ
nr:MAG TPA: hypothetical protein [Crassvirales sp.]